MEQSTKKVSFKPEKSLVTVVRISPRHEEEFRSCSTLSKSSSNGKKSSMLSASSSSAMQNVGVRTSLGGNAAQQLQLAGKSLDYKMMQRSHNQQRPYTSLRTGEYTHNSNSMPFGGSIYHNASFWQSMNHVPFIFSDSSSGQLKTLARSSSFTSNMKSPFASSEPPTVASKQRTSPKTFFSIYRLSSSASINGRTSGDSRQIVMTRQGIK